jgi:hypothetical protein
MHPLHLMSDFSGFIGAASAPPMPLIHLNYITFADLRTEPNGMLTIKPITDGGLMDGAAIERYEMRSVGQLKLNDLDIVVAQPPRRSPATSPMAARNHAADM